MPHAYFVNYITFVDLEVRCDRLKIGENMKLKETVNIKKYFINKGYVECSDEILKEYVFSIYLNDNLLVELLCIPIMLKELVLGYLYTERIIENLEDIINIDINEDEAYAKVNINKAEYSETGDKVTTDSGDFRYIPYQFYKRNNLERLKKIDFDPEVLVENFQSLIGKSELFKNTGNVHSVQICRGNKKLYFAEDIGRYNAFDKCVGQAILDGEDLTSCCLYTSGRIPSTIAMKAVRAGIPIIVSRSAPSDKTLEVAKKFNLTIVGFATKEKINIYNVQDNI